MLDLTTAKVDKTTPHRQYVWNLSTQYLLSCAHFYFSEIKLVGEIIYGAAKAVKQKDSERDFLMNVMETDQYQLYPSPAHSLLVYNLGSSHNLMHRITAKCLLHHTMAQRTDNSALKAVS